MGGGQNDSLVNGYAHHIVHGLGPARDGLRRWAVYTAVRISMIVKNAANKFHCSWVCPTFAPDAALPVAASP